MDFIHETEVRILYGTPNPVGFGIGPYRMRTWRFDARSAATGEGQCEVLGHSPERSESILYGTPNPVGFGIGPYI